MNDDLDELLTPEDRVKLAEWDADAYRLVVEVPTSKLTDQQLDDLSDAINDAVDMWLTHCADDFGERDWDPFIYGHGPMHRKAATPPDTLT